MPLTSYRYWHIASFSDVSPEKSSAYISEADEEPSDHDDVKKKKKKQL